MKSISIRRLTVAAMMLALGLVLPFLTGQVPQFGNMLCPMHIPVLLCGFVCGWPYGLVVGAVTPILRGLIFGRPMLMPTGLCMAFELAAYGVAAGILYEKLYGKKGGEYLTLVLSMVIGRIVWGIAAFVIYSLFTQKTFTLALFWTETVVNAIPGILLQLVLIPAIVLALRAAKLVPIRD